MSDAAYMDAVRRGDLSTAQRLVDAAANAAGYTIESFHGTNGDLFTVFDPGRGGEKTGADSAALGIFSTDNSRVAQQYAENYGVGGAMGLMFGSGPLAAARDEALATPDGKRLVRRLEDAKEEVKRAFEKVRKKAMNLVLEQAEEMPSLKKMLSEYGEKAGKSLLERMAQVAWSDNELYNDKIIVDAEKSQRDAEESLSDYITPFIAERIPNKRVMQLRLKIKNPKIYDAGHKTPAQFSLSDKIQSALEKGYDGVIFNNIIDPIESATHYVVFNSDQIKLANAVTKDDSGRVIPLSQRFNDQSRDIRNPRTTPKQFPYEYAAYLKAHFPAIWAAGGNIRGNDTYRWWTAYRKGDRSPTVMHWWNVTRPAWIARHYRDYRLPGVIAQIKWGTIGTLGVAGMKRVVEDAIRKKY